MVLMYYESMQLIYTIFGTGLYFYAITILTQYGFNSYFGIPSHLMEASIRDNIIFSFSVLKTIASIDWWILVSISIGILIILYILQYLKFTKTFIITIVLLASIFGFYYLGQFIAKTKETFTIIQSTCLDEKENITYVIPAFYQTNALITPIYTNTNKLTGNFIIKDISEPNCEIFDKVIGPITK